MKKRMAFQGFIPFLLLWGCFTATSAWGSEPLVGAAMCKGCHTGYYDSYLPSLHGQKAVPNSPANKNGCESCHGAGGDHVKKPSEKGSIIAFGKKTKDARVKSARCLACHEESATAFWDLGKHERAGVSCDSCHTAHSTTKKNLKTREPELCNTCHRDIAVQTGKQSHHPIKEMGMKCTSCRDPHGGFSAKMIKGTSTNELCYQCHAEKRGPFMWAHPPVEENCLSCHAPHGSNHSKLLTNRVPMLCQSCHNTAGHPSNAYTRFDTFSGPQPSNRMFAHSCLNCHSNIHGNNGPSTRGKFNVR